MAVVTHKDGIKALIVLIAQVGDLCYVNESFNIKQGEDNGLALVATNSVQEEAVWHR